ncbi:MAG: hypothetical protein AAGF85_10675 [Bacteroidota bacterium]
MKKLLSLLAAVGVMFALSSCGDDDDGGTPSLDAPVVTAPAAASVQVSTDATVDFAYTAAAGFASAAVTPTGGTATITTDGTAGATSGTITVTFSAGTTAGAGSVILTVTDTDGNTGNATAVLTITSEPVTPVVSVRGDIDTNITWTAANIYQLDTRVTVLDGVTLTIEPGTVIKGNEGQGAAATALLVAKGGTLNAQGTAALPIIFTSTLDPIEPSDIAAGNYASTTSETEDGLWGGVIILGNAPITGKIEDEDGNLIADNLTELQIEGIPSSDENGLYGGSTADDNSGTISYISIRHGGTNIGAGNEINGLTLGAVGSATTISNVEVVANADDGIEFFGGNVSINGALVWNSFDDSMDSDQDWNGTVENFIIVTPQTGSAFELDGPEGSNTRGVNHVFDEGVVYVGDNADHIVDWDDDTNATLTNIYFFGVESGNIETFGGNGAGTNDGWETDLTAAGAFFDGVPGGSIDFNVAVGSKTVGPTAADFAWTWAGNSGALGTLGL